MKLYRPDGTTASHQQIEAVLREWHEVSRVKVWGDRFGWWCEIGGETHFGNTIRAAVSRATFRALHLVRVMQTDQHPAPAVCAECKHGANVKLKPLDCEPEVTP